MEEGDEGYESRDSAERSSKRIRLSPEERRKMSSARGTLERRRRGGREVISPTGARGRVTYSARRHDLSSSTAASLPFAHSLSQSAVKKPTTRDRLGEANALIDRIRARATEKESRKAEAVLPSYPDELDLESSDDEDAPPAQSLRPTVSPRKLLRRLSASDEVDLELDALFPSPSPFSPAQPLPTSPLPHLALAAQSSLRSALGSSTSPRPTPPSAVEPSSATRRHFARTPVSPNKPRLRGRLEGIFGAPSSEGDSGHVRHRSITTIGPEDVQALLASAGPSRMVFDQETARWVKSRTVSIGLEEGESESTEDDPFRDCEITRSSEKELEGLEKEVLEGLAREEMLSGLGITAGTPGTPRLVVSPPDANYFEEAPVEEREESEEEVWGAGGESEEETGTTDGLLESEESPFHLFRAAQGEQVEEDEDEEDEDEDEEEHVDDLVSAILPQDIAEPLALVSSPTPSRPILSSPDPQTASITLDPVAPRSALKPTVRSHSEPNLATPRYRLVDADKSPRSVSFSDGKTSGRIEGLHEREERERAGSRLKFEVGRGEGTQFEVGEPGSLEMETPEKEEGDGTVGSTRTRGIDRALQALEFSGESRFRVAKKKLTTSRAGPEVTPTASNPSRSSIVIGSFESAPKVRPRTSRSPTQSRTFRRTTAADATFLTECSFGVSHERLVQFITDVEPFEPDWEGLNSINLSGKGVESLVRLKEFLPKLDEGNL
mgnify:FL=1